MFSTYTSDFHRRTKPRDGEMFNAPVPLGAANAEKLIARIAFNNKAASPRFFLLPGKPAPPSPRPEIFSLVALELEMANPPEPIISSIPLRDLSRTSTSNQFPRGRRRYLFLNEKQLPRASKAPFTPRRRRRRNSLQILTSVLARKRISRNDRCSPYTRCPETCRLRPKATL